MQINTENAKLFLEKIKDIFEIYPYNLGKGDYLSNVEIANYNIIINSYDSNYEGYTENYQIIIPLSEINHDLQFFKDKFQALLNEKLEAKKREEERSRKYTEEVERATYERLKKKYES